MTWRMLIAYLLAAALAVPALALPCKGCSLPGVLQPAGHRLTAGHCAGQMEAAGGDEILSSAHAGQCPQSRQLCIAAPASFNPSWERTGSAPITGAFAGAPTGTLNSATHAEIISNRSWHSHSHPSSSLLHPAAVLSLRI